jgi:hypothetical protein
VPSENKESKSEYVTVRIPESMKLELEKIATNERRSVSQVIFLLLESALDTRKNGAKSK